MKFTNPFKKTTVTTKDKVVTEIENIEFKKNSILSAITTAENEFERQKTNCFAQLGEYVYRCHLDNKEDYELTEFFQTITDMEKILDDKKDKVRELSDRYEEEISLLSVNLNAIKAQEDTIMIDAKIIGKFCNECGKSISSDDTYCQGCGKKL